MNKKASQKLEPLVSVIVPTYNREWFIEQALWSILNQTYQNIEIIVVDDGSIDNTKKIIARLIQKDNRIIYICHDKNRGAQAARNTGIRAARGEYIAFLDSDNEWFPEKLQQQIDLFAKSQYNPGVVYCGFQKIFFDNNYVVSTHSPLFQGNIYTTALQQWIADTSTLIVKRDILFQAGLFDEHIRAYQEWDLCIRLAKIAPFDYIPNILVLYYVHQKPTISNNLLLSAWGYLDVIQAHQSAILQKCDSQMLSEHYIAAGKYFLSANCFDLAKHSYIRAAYLNPFSLKTLVHASVSLTGEHSFSKIMNIKHQINLLRIFASRMRSTIFSKNKLKNRTGKI